MKKILVCISLMFIIVACSNENDYTSTDEVKITKAFVKENAEIGLSYSEVRERFGTEALSGVFDNTETWLYDSTQSNDFKYNQTADSIASEEIKSGNLGYQLYINFIEEEAYMYSYFYLGEDGKVWQYQVNPYSEPLHIPVSN